MGHATMLSSQPDVTDVAMSSEQVLLNPVPTRLCHVIHYHGEKKFLASGNRDNTSNFLFRIMIGLFSQKQI